MSSPIPKPTPAEEYERVLVPAMFVPCTRLLLDRAAPRPSERVLDLACGSGIVARHVAVRVGVGGSVVAVDSTPGMLAVARSLPVPDGAPVEWREAEASALDLPDNSFDLVLCQQGLQFFPDRIAALREVNRVLRRTGRAAFAIWRGRNEQPFFGPMCEAELRHLAPLGVTRQDVEAFVSLGDAAEIGALLRGASFRRISVDAETVEADFDASTFIRNAEFGYSAFMPQFRDKPEAFEAYIAAVERDMEKLIAAYRVGDRLKFPVPVHIVTAAA